MRARARSLLGAAALAALLAALVTVARLGVDRPDEVARARHELDTRALPFRPEEVVAVVIAPRGAPAVRLEREGSGWQVRAGEGPPSLAVGGAVEGLLDRLASMRTRATSPASPETLAGRGLEPPVVRVAVTLRDGRILALDLGDENGFDRTRSCRRGDRVLVVEGVPPALLDPAPDRLLAQPGGG